MSMDGRYPENAGAIFRVCFGWTANFCSCKIGIPAFHGGRILKMQEQLSGYSWLAAKFLLLQCLHSHHPWWYYF